MMTGFRIGNLGIVLLVEWIMIWGLRASGFQVDGWWLMVDGWWLMADGWWLMVDGWGSMVGGWWLMVVGRWSMVDSWRLMVDDWWSTVDGWRVTVDGLRLTVNGFRFTVPDQELTVYGLPSEQRRSLGHERGARQPSCRQAPNGSRFRVQCLRCRIYLLMVLGLGFRDKCI